MLVQTLEQLPVLTDTESLCVDVETTTNIPTEIATHAFDGHSETCGYAISTMEPDPSVRRTWYIPLRHHSGVKDENLPLEPALEWLRKTLGTSRKLYNHNIKFDYRWWRRDGINPQGDLVCTMVLARMIKCDMLSYSLNVLGSHFVPDFKTKSKFTADVKAYLKGLPRVDKKEVKDYGLVPASIMAEYAENDVRLTAELAYRLMGKLPEHTRFPQNDKQGWSVFDVDMGLLRWLSEWEIHGVPLDNARLKENTKDTLRAMIKLTQECIELAGEEFDPSSEPDVTRILCGKFGIVPKYFTAKAHRPQWNGMSLRTLLPDVEKIGVEEAEKAKKLGILLARYVENQLFYGTFCKGWLERVGTDNRLHCDFRIDGTGTGRLSCRDPNMQNVPPRAETVVAVPPGYCIVAWDYSQIEYRIFGHYTEDPFILNSYRNDPKADFHSLLAGQLGVDRQFAKQLNFSFLYGMGKGKLLQNLAGILTLKAGESEEMKEKMRLMAWGKGTTIAEKAKSLTVTEEAKELAFAIYERYHAMFPSIRQFQRRVKSAVKHRGWVRNFFGRVYNVDMAWVHAAVNYVIQGSAADLFKNRLFCMFNQFKGQFDYSMITNVHDSLIVMVRANEAKDFYVQGTKILEADLGFKLPIKVEGKVSTRTWGHVEKVKDFDDFDAAMERSQQTAVRETGIANAWDRDAKAEDPKKSGRYNFGAGTGGKNRADRVRAEQDANADNAGKLLKGIGSQAVN